MKKLILGATLAALLAAPAFAQSYDPAYGTGNAMPMPPSWEAQTGTADWLSSLAYAPPRAGFSRLRDIRAEAAPSATTGPVYAYGRYAGADPDANIRFQLHRDPPGLD
jgi:opacity protein-like surface antigen